MSGITMNYCCILVVFFAELLTSTISTADSTLDSLEPSHEIYTSCVPVAHDALWVRLNMEPSVDIRRLSEFDPTWKHGSRNHRGRGSTSRRRREIETVLEEHRFEDTQKQPPNNQRDLDVEISRLSRGPASKSREISMSRRQRRSYWRTTLTTKKPASPSVDATTSSTEVFPVTLDVAAVFRKTSWQCRVETQWKKMEDGTFPPYVQTGRCKQTKCMLGMYECTPKRYAVKVLRRVDKGCYPLPTVSVNSTYEDAWSLAEYKVVIGCECSRRRDTGAYVIEAKDME